MQDSVVMHSRDKVITYMNTRLGLECSNPVLNYYTCYNTAKKCRSRFSCARTRKVQTVNLKILSYLFKVIVAINFVKRCSVPESCFAQRGIQYNTTFGFCESTYVSVNSKPYYLPPPPPVSSCLGGRFCSCKLCWGAGFDGSGGIAENSRYGADSYSKSPFQYPYRV